MSSNILMVLYYSIFDFRWYYILCVPWLTLGWIFSYKLNVSPNVLKLRTDSDEPIDTKSNTESAEPIDVDVRMRIQDIAVGTEHPCLCVDERQMRMTQSS